MQPFFYRGDSKEVEKLIKGTFLSAILVPLGWKNLPNERERERDQPACFAEPFLTQCQPVPFCEGGKEMIKGED